MGKGNKLVKNVNNVNVTNKMDVTNNENLTKRQKNNDEPMIFENHGGSSDKVVPEGSSGVSSNADRTVNNATTVNNSEDTSNKDKPSCDTHQYLDSDNGPFIVHMTKLIRLKTYTI